MWLSPTRHSVTRSRRRGAKKWFLLGTCSSRRQGRRPRRKSDLAMGLGFPPVTLPCWIPCVTNARSALAPCPRSEGLSLCGHGRLSEHREQKAEDRFLEHQLRAGPDGA